MNGPRCHSHSPTSFLYSLSPSPLLHLLLLLLPLFPRFCASFTSSFSGVNRGRALGRVLRTIFPPVLLISTSPSAPHHFLLPFLLLCLFPLFLLPCSYDNSSSRWKGLVPVSTITFLQLYLVFPVPAPPPHSPRSKVYKEKLPVGTPFSNGFNFGNCL